MAYSKRQGLVIASQRIVWRRPVVWVASMVLVVALIGSITTLLTRQTTAKIQAYPLVQASVDQSVSRVYRASNVSTPGAPLAATNAVATLPKGENNFRVRIGLTNREQSTVTAGKNNITSISASKYSHTCATTTYYYMYCWGENQYGVIGDGTTQSESKPTKPVQAGALAGKTIKEGYSGGVHSCALASDDNVYC